MEIVTAIITPVVNTLMVPVTNHLRYLISCTKYVRDMRIKMRELEAARLGVEDHINRNKRSHLEVPTQVTSWLEEVEKINAKVGNIPNDAGSCCNLKIRHKLGRKAFKMIEEIDSVTRQHSLINWTDDPIPLGRVDSVVVSTSTPSSDHNDFPSREHTFTEALRALGPSNKSHMIALWGMGGVGKTTMMQKLKNVVKEKKIFDNYVEAVIGEKTDPIAIQDAVAEYLGIELKESTKPARAEKLRKWFEARLDGSKIRVLIILDDVWQLVDMNDIGLSPLPNQGVDFKVLLTSRDKDVCFRMGVEAHSIFNVKALPKAEAQSFFYQFFKDSNVADLEDPAFLKIGDRIVNRCQGLPIAIRTIAYTLKGRSKQVWEDAVTRLEHHDNHKVVHEVFKISYNNLQDEESESIFLLCGLFPEDFDIPKEDLLKYGWGLKLFKRVSTIREARNRLNTCVERLIHTNLLIQSDNVGCVKMHDLALAFVLDIYSKDKHALFVNHSNILEWPVNDMSDSQKRISLTCKGINEIPRYLKFPNLSLLKLMHGDKSLRFPKDFYGEMEKLQVISSYKIMYPLFPSLLRCSTNLRVLYLHQCSLIFDCSSIGNLLNLEVLSFANSGIKWLPSAIGNLKKLRLLDLTGCVCLRIDNGVLKGLVKLDELYMRVADDRKGISFTDNNCNEMAERCKNLSSLEFEFFENNVQPKNMSFEKLERFKISVGRYLDVSERIDGDFSKSWQPHENTLQLITHIDDLLESGMNKLFEKTEVLFLQVDGMNDVKDVEVKSSHLPQSSSFYNIRILVVSSCSDLKYLFRVGVAKALSNLEHLEVFECPILEALVHTNGSEEETVTFPKLKVLHLETLAKFSGLSNNVSIIELPQLLALRFSRIPNFTSIYPENESGASCILKEEILIPKLEKLCIEDMENLKEIWPCDYLSTSKGNVSTLREIEVGRCDDLVNLFPRNPMPFFHHLEEVKVIGCGSIEVIFNIDLDCVDEIGHEGSSNSRLTVIHAEELGKLREVWRVKGEKKSGIPMIRGFQAVESITIRRCNRFRDVFTPYTTNFDLGELRDILIENWGESGRNNVFAEGSEEQEEEASEANATTTSTAVLIPSFHNLRKLVLYRYEGVQLQVVFEIKGSTSTTELVTTATTHHDNQQRQLLPYLEYLFINEMDRMTHLWKISRNDILMLQMQQSQSPFHNLTTILLYNCNNIKYLFSDLMAKLLSNLKTIEIQTCDGIEELVSNKHDEDEESTTSTSTSTHTSTTIFPHLDSLTLGFLKNLRCIDGGCGGVEVGNNEIISFNNTATTTGVLDQSKIPHVGGVSWFLCQYSREIYISHCDNLSSVIPSYALGQTLKLQVLKIMSCQSMKEVFETQGINSNTMVDEGDGGTRAIPRLNNFIVHKLPNLKILEIYDCGLLEDVFTFSALKSLRQLEELMIKNCKALKVIVKEEKHDEGEQATSSSKVVDFPRLKSIELVNLPELVGFFLGMNEFRWPSLDKVTIMDCPQMTVFAPGGSITPKLKYIETSLGQHSLECGLNFRVTTILHRTQLSSLDSTSSCLPTSEGKPWSFQNLINLDMNHNAFVEKIIPSSELLQLQKLQTLHVESCHLVDEVLESLEGTNSGFEESKTTLVRLPNLREVDIKYLPRLRNMWRSNRWTVYEFPNLTKVSLYCCDKLEHVFISSMVGSLLKLQELRISYCNCMKVIVKDTSVVEEEEEEKSDHGIMNDIMLSHLRSLKLFGLPSLEGFCIGKEDFSFPLLNTLRIKKCPAITTFTMGNSATPELAEVETSFGLCHLKEEDDLNTFIKMHQEEFKRQ